MNAASLVAGTVSGVAASGQSGTVTKLELALIPAAAALVGVLVGIYANNRRERAREQRAARYERDRAIAEMLTATADLLSGIQAARATYDRSAWRAHIRTVATVYTAATATFSGEQKLTPGTFLDWRKSAPFLDRLLATDRGLSDQQRTLAMDLAGVLLPRTSRFFAALAVLTLGPDKELADAAKDLADAVAGLLEVIAAKDRKYVRARRAAEKALATFRSTADQRRR